MSKFSIDFMEEDTEVLLIALQSPLEIYRLVYMLNRELNTQFCRNRTGLYDKETQAQYAVYQWNKPNDEVWYVIANEYKETQQSYGLFDQLEKTQVLIREYAKFNYFLKIDNVSSFFSVDSLTDVLRTMKYVHFFHLVELNSLKSKYKLIVC